MSEDDLTNFALSGVLLQTLGQFREITADKKPRASGDSITYVIRNSFKMAVFQMLF